MGTTLLICLFLATQLHAESMIARYSSATSISVSTTAAPDSSLSANATTSSSLFDVDEELAKIAASCLSSKNHEQLTGNVVRHGVARGFTNTLLIHTVTTIGLTELRARLKFAPLRAWQAFNNTEPSEGELESAPTLEAYYDLKEPRSKMRSLDSEKLFEHNIAAAIAYLDKGLPSIRKMYRRKFVEIRFDPGVLDKKAIDRMIVEFLRLMTEYTMQFIKCKGERRNAGMMSIR